LSSLRHQVIRYYPILQQDHMILKRILIREVDPHPVLLVELDHRLVDNYPSGPAERLEQNLHHIIEPCRDILCWNTPIAQPLVDDITDTRAHRLQDRVEAVVDRFMERGYKRCSQDNQPSMRRRTAPPANTHAVTMTTPS
jgi:hypothetical protein